MKTVFQLSKFVCDSWPGRGIIREIAEFTGLERHTISALLKNSVKYVSLDTVSRISEYLISERGVDPAILPGALFGKEPDHFWDVLADRQHISFALATRTHAEWPDAEFLMASDSHFHGVMVAKLSSLGGPGAQSTQLAIAASAATAQPKATAEEGAAKASARKAPATSAAQDGGTPRVFADPYLIPAPRRVPVKRGRQTGWDTVHDGQQQAEEVYRKIRGQTGASAAFTVGSVKVNGVLERLLSDIFDAEPFVSQDGVTTARHRSCPIYFRYRDFDPAPESLCGGTQLAKRQASPTPGIYYETAKGKWECCPWEKDKRDVGFVVYTYRPSADEVQLACGGFSGRATSYLTARLSEIIPRVWPPQFRAPDLHVGLLLATFDIRHSARGRKQASNADFQHHVIRLDDQVLKRRLKRHLDEPGEDEADD